jgi:hypothetical protein
MNAASFDFAEVREQRCEKLVRTAHQTTRAGVQVVVRYAFEVKGGTRIVRAHRCTLHRDFRASAASRGAAFERSNEFFSAAGRNAFERDRSWRQSQTARRPADCGLQVPQKLSSEIVLGVIFFS